MKSKQVILVGGFCEMFELCARCGIEVAGVIDASPAAVRGYDIPYLGTDEVVLADLGRFSHVPLVIVPDAPALRRRIVERYRAAGFCFASVVSPDADVSPTSEMGEGVVIQSHVVISAQARIGAFARLNVGAIVGHECQVGDFVTVAPKVTLCGRVRVDEGAYIGTNSTIIPGRIIGRDSKVGAGSVVIRNVPAGVTVFGIPAVKINV